MINAIVLLVILGFCLYLVETYIPMNDTIKILIRAVVVLFSIIYILHLFGLVSLPAGIR